jgi:SAM-dependent methyltransferase
MVDARRPARSRVNSSRVYLDAFVSEAARSLPAGSLVLDAGAGNSPYKQHFTHARYESADFCKLDDGRYSGITYVCDLTSIPVESCRYDLVLCNQVLEHVPEPRAVLAELHRVLRPGGELRLTAPLFYEEHEVPFDFYRYTQFGFAYLLQSAGFELKRIDWLEGYFGTLSYQLDVAARSLPRNARDYGGGTVGVAVAGAVLLLRPMMVLLSQAFARLDLRKRYVAGGHCKNFAVVALRRED